MVACLSIDIDFSLVGQVAQQRHGSALQSVLRFSRGCCQCFTVPPTNGCGCLCQWNVFGPFSYPSVVCPPVTRLVAHGLFECATETWFFSFRLVCSLLPKSTTTDIGFESTFAAAMLCFIHDDCVSFRWRGFSCSWLWVSLSFRHGDCANTGCTADIGLLIHPLRPNVCCDNAVIGVAACVCLLVWPYIL